MVVQESVGFVTGLLGQVRHARHGWGTGRSLHSPYTRTPRRVAAFLCSGTYVNGACNLCISGPADAFAAYATAQGPSPATAYGSVPGLWCLILEHQGPPAALHKGLCSA